MKTIKFSLFSRYVWCALIFSLSTFSAFSQTQRAYMRASNCNCSILVPTSIGSIQWYGACYNGYCDGNGTVNYYDQNGNSLGKFAGNVTQGTLNGYGTRYYNDGTIVYRGNLINNDFVDEAPFVLADNLVGDFVVDSLLSGGINRRCEVVKAIFSPNDELQEIRYRVSCNGQIIADNFYTCTLVITPNTYPYVNMVDVNDNAQVFIAVNLVRYTKQILDWARQKQNH